MKHWIIPDIVRDQQLCQLPRMGTAYEAAKQMTECNVAAVAVTDEEGVLEGIVTERDLTRRVIGKKLDPKEVKLKQIMTEKPDTLSPKDTAYAALGQMREQRYRHLPVVDDEGHLVGMVSIRDLYRAVKIELEADIREAETFVFGDRYGA